jgi:thymidylate kinase
LSDRLLVFGSLPLQGRDLDLLVRSDSEHSRVVQWLEQHGFERRGDRWARFDGAAVAVVELVRAKEWQLPAADIDMLYAEAEPLKGMRNVARPSAAHTLLLLARKRAWRGGGISNKHRRRIDAAITDDPRAWTRAEARAEAWRLSASLRCLRAAYLRKQAGFRNRASALAEATARAGDGSSLVGARRVGRRLLTPKRGHLFALSGLDGAGKSSQAATLAQTLDVLGRKPIVVWSPIGSTGVIGSVGQSGRRLVAVVTAAPARYRSHRARGERAGSSSPVAANQHRLVGATWVILMGLADAVTQLRTAMQLMRGCDVICDRYALDSAVHLLHRYGETRLVRLQIALIVLVSPQPRRAFFLAVRPEVAAKRKVDRWSERDLRHRFDLYCELRSAYGARLVNGEQPPDRVAAEIAREVWRSLPSP